VCASWGASARAVSSKLLLPFKRAVPDDVLLPKDVEVRSVGDSVSEVLWGVDRENGLLVG
jgi:hypothetical protein